MSVMTTMFGWLWDQIPVHWQVRVPARVFRWFEHQAWRRDARR